MSVYLLYQYFFHFSVFNLNLQNIYILLTNNIKYIFTVSSATALTIEILPPFKKQAIAEPIKNPNNVNPDHNQI